MAAAHAGAVTASGKQRLQVARLDAHALAVRSMRGLRVAGHATNAAGQAGNDAPISSAAHRLRLRETALELVAESGGFCGLCHYAYYSYWRLLCVALRRF